ncbi:uncharacterized protein PAC_14504 [Phialocephala subalpina]|uniref:Dienelactone hydrolase domain-containing protein n=1 Tax=Phialocephala subalpina TaxID=576137 RepID=A0A1L7XI30_9HELO|nr:uncharacterized protein PAC_14504 [Phialocephala subalpina]
MTESLHPCCDPSSPSPIWEGNPTGTIISICGIETYIAHPNARDLSSDQHPSSNPKHEKVILFLTEGHGIYLPNAQLLADSFAHQLSIPVIMPDQFAGQARLPKDIVPSFPSSHATVPWTEDKDDPNYELRGLKAPVKENSETSDAYRFEKPPWWKKQAEGEFEKWKARHEPIVTDPILEKVVGWIRETYGEDVKIGGIGYCFGGRYIMRLMGAGVIDVGVVNHPSFYTMDEVAKLGNGTRLAIFAAEKDDILPKEKRRETEDVLEGTETTWRSTVYSGTEHGFSVRGDLTVKEVRLAKESAFRGAVQWFREWL